MLWQTLITDKSLMTIGSGVGIILTVSYLVWCMATDRQNLISRQAYLEGDVASSEERLIKAIDELKAEVGGVSRRVDSLVKHVTSKSKET